MKMADEKDVSNTGSMEECRSAFSVEMPLLEPLCFPEEKQSCQATQSQCSTVPTLPLYCLFCDQTFEDTGVRKNDALLHHLLVVHQLVIADVDVIADFKSYVQYWKKRFGESSITDICTVININTKAEDIGPKLQYYLLCDGLPEDKQIREELQFKKLQKILQQQQEERTDSHFSRVCLFCSLHFEGNRSSLFQHMVKDHGFNVGLPDNLVFVNELLDTLDEKLKNLLCLYCEKSFKDRQTLKEHMRKKQHKKINPKNKEFDKYYIINYLELGKSWHDIHEEDDSELNRKFREEEWGDWKEESLPVYCLFCEAVDSSTQGLLKHVRECHNFDLLKIKKALALDFYQEVKIVNYIRRKVYDCKCIFCKEQFDSRVNLLLHQSEKSHFKLPEKSSWNQPEYFFPTFENDSLLCGLPDDDDDDECHYEGNGVAENNTDAVINDGDLAASGSNEASDVAHGNYTGNNAEDSTNIRENSTDGEDDVQINSKSCDECGHAEQECDKDGSNHHEGVDHENNISTNDVGNHQDGGYDEASSDKRDNVEDSSDTKDVGNHKGNVNDASRTNDVGNHQDGGYYEASSAKRDDVEDSSDTKDVGNQKGNVNDTSRTNDVGNHQDAGYYEASIDKRDNVEDSSDTKDVGNHKGNVNDASRTNDVGNYQNGGYYEASSDKIDDVEDSSDTKNVGDHKENVENASRTKDVYDHERNVEDSNGRTGVEDHEDGDYDEINIDKRDNVEDSSSTRNVGNHKENVEDTSGRKDVFDHKWNVEDSNGRKDVCDREGNVDDSNSTNDGDTHDDTGYDEVNSDERDNVADSSDTNDVGDHKGNVEECNGRKDIGDQKANMEDNSSLKDVEDHMSGCHVGDTSVQRDVGDHEGNVKDTSVIIDDGDQHGGGHVENDKSAK